MNNTISYSAQEVGAQAGNPILNIAVFIIFIVVTMGVVIKVGKSTS